METQLLVRQIIEGSEPAFEKLFRLFYGRLTGYANSLLNDREQAEEIVQDVFANIWSGRTSLNVDLAIRAYLFRAVHNRCMNHFRHEQVKQQHQQYTVALSSYQHESAGSRLAISELKSKIDEGLALLPPACREVFRLSRMEELSYREIAEVLNISVKTVENQMGKALRLMRIHLADFLTLLLILQVFTKKYLLIGVDLLSGVINKI
ncbi:MAG: RNA polymerase sigma-70 factor [Bacteroidia bacterium]